jgi:hypothetical protein
VPFVTTPGAQADKALSAKMLESVQKGVETMTSKGPELERGDQLLSEALGLAVRHDLSFVRWLITHRISREIVPDHVGEPPDSALPLRSTKTPTKFGGAIVYSRDTAIAIYERLEAAALMFSQTGDTATENEVRCVMGEVDQEHRVLQFRSEPSRAVRLQK